MNFLLLNKMSVHDYQPISSIADALACISPKWYLTVISTNH